MTGSDNNGNGERGMSLDALKAGLAARGGRQFWRSLDELAETPEYREFVEKEFPHDPEKESGVHRRDVLKLMAASAAMAGLSACTKLPEEKIVPYVVAPEQIVPGKPLFYATAMPHGGAATGLLVESHMGRPTKIEGNTMHPGSLGATDAIAQAAILTFYDPDRSPVVVREGRVSTWAAFTTFLKPLMEDRKRMRGAGMRLLTESVISPTLGAQIRELLTIYPEAKWHQWEPAGRDAAREGARLAFGRYVNTVCHFDKADVVVSIDSDFLHSGPGAVRYAREFMSRRKLEGPESKMNRLYAVESSPTTAGAIADHRLPLRASEIENFTRSLAAALGVKIAGASLPAGIPEKWLLALVRDLREHRGASLVVAGEYQPAAVHALVHAINAELGNAGRTVEYTDPIEAEPVNQLESFRALVEDMRDPKKVDLLFIIGPNPVYSAPPDLEFLKHLLGVRTRVHMGIQNDETAEQCHWHIPQAHFLESWSDARAYDGTVTFIQPLIAPIYEGRTAHELVAEIAGKPGQTAHDLVRDFWKAQRGEKDPKAFEAYWETSLHDGMAAGTALPAKPAPIAASFAASLPAPAAPVSGVEVTFRPDPTVFDGRYANNGWLQELPKPFSTLTWDNAAILSPATAAKMGVSNGDTVKLTTAGRDAAVTAPVWMLPGQPDDSVTLHLGYGRTRAGRVGNGQGFDAGRVRMSSAMWVAAGMHIDRTGDSYELAATQHHHVIDQAGHAVEIESQAVRERNLVRVATLDEFHKNPAFAREEEEEKTAGLTLYPGFPYEGYSWGMAVDMQSCVGCGACVVACQAENNIPVVGKTEVIRGREMHWIRIDTYYRDQAAGDLKNPEVYYQPMFCMHCENAPCEGVCPVGATVHSTEGLNEMVYNRCVGTRYCSNNCPYKVRRFNFLLFADWTTPSLYGARNPNVSVRSRGVMEKCTYCVQRIQAAKIDAEKDNDRAVRDGEILTACQQVCPTEALVFGNINDPKSRVSRLKAQERNYSLLDDLNTRPRTTYLARVRNPNPELEG